MEVIPALFISVFQDEAPVSWCTGRMFCVLGLNVSSTASMNINQIVLLLCHKVTWQQLMNMLILNKTWVLLSKEENVEVNVGTTACSI